VRTIIPSIVPPKMQAKATKEIASSLTVPLSSLIRDHAATLRKSKNGFGDRSVRV
jgi:hypothetical protein